MFASTPFRPLLLIVRCSSIPLCSHHGPASRGFQCSCWRPRLRRNTPRRRLIHPDPRTMLRSVLVAVDPLHRQPTISARDLPVPVLQCNCWSLSKYFPAIIRQAGPHVKS